MITTAQAQAIWRAGTGAFVDAMPDVPRPANLPAGTIWRGKQRLNIPGSTWLADTGYGELSAAAVEDYLRSGLEGITGGDRAKLLVIYCLRDCWMSWNVAKRAISWGYSNVAWYPDGTDGWQDADFRSSRRFRRHSKADSPTRAIAGSRARAQTTVVRSGPAPRRHSRWFCSARRKCAYPTRRG